MSIVTTDSANYTAIAGAIRGQLGVQTTYRPEDMAEAIAGIRGGAKDRTKLNYSVYASATAPATIKNGRYALGMASTGTYMSALTEDLTNLCPKWNEPFEIKTVAWITAAYNRGLQVILTGDGVYNAPTIAFLSGLTGIVCMFSTNGSSETNSISFGTADGIHVQLNTPVEIHTVWDGSTYTATVNDGTNTVTKSVTPASAHYYNASKALRVGGSGAAAYLMRNAVVDLDETFVKVNNTVVWGCV